MRSAFEQLDFLLRLQGGFLEAAGFGPKESPYRSALERAAFRLRDYGGPREGPAVLILPAPIKKAYLWDISPQSSVVRRLLEAGLRVWLMEWKAPEEQMQGLGLSEYAGSFIRESLKEVGKETGRGRAFIAAHSLGGTLAAIFASQNPELVEGLVLAASPLNFGKGGGSLDEAVALFGGLPGALGMPGNVPGSYLDTVASSADPETFLFYPMRDFVKSISSPEDMRRHLLVRRWMLDETPLPGVLFSQVVQWLYKEDRFMRGLLEIGGSPALPQAVTAPVLAFIDRGCRVVPPSSVLPFMDKAGSREKKILWYPPDEGILFRHAGVLVGRAAHSRVWPEIAGWIAGKGN